MLLYIGGVILQPQWIGKPAMMNTCKDTKVTLLLFGSGLSVATLKRKHPCYHWGHNLGPLGLQSSALTP